LAIVKNEIPLLEYDTEKDAVISPWHEGLEISLPEKCVFAFLGEHIDKYAIESKALKVAEFISATKTYPIYVLEYKGESIALCQAPVGAAAAAQLLDWLIGYGVRKIVSAGSCGCLVPIPEGTFLVPLKALRDEGTSYHYAPPSRYIDIKENARQAIEKALIANRIKYQEVITWSTDGFYRETREKVQYRRDEGCSVVEMECSALAACAAFRGTEWAMLLYTADSLADADNYDERSWGHGVEGLALRLCLDAVLNI